MMKKIGMGIFVLAFFMCSGCSTMPKKPDSLGREDYFYTKDYISWLIKKEMKKNDVTGLSLALVDDQRIVWAEGFGFADEGKNIPATPDTVYRVGSISKLFTATAAMQLAEQGKLDIDQPLQSYLPEFSVKSRFAGAIPSTPRTLMTHHSGLPSDLQKGMWVKKDPEYFSAVVQHLQKEYAAFPPNTVFSYSSLGMTLLGLVVGKVAGSDFVSQMNESLLRPLGMTHSSFSTSCDPSSLASKAYRKGTEVEEPALRDLPAGGLNANVLDLSRFMQMVFAEGKAGARQILKPETLAEMLRPQNTTVALDMNFRVGLGWQLSGMGGIDIKNAGTVAHHGGATIHYHSMMILLPEHKLGVVVLSNTFSSRNVVNKAAEEMLKLALEAKAGIRQPDPKESFAQEGALPEETLRSYEGRYATYFGMVPVSVKRGHLRALVMGAPLNLIPRSDGLLGLQFKLFGLIPISLGQLDRVGISRATVAGHDILKASANEQELLVGERIQPVPIPETWQRRLGKYEIINAGDDHILVEGIGLRDDAGLLVIDLAIPLVFTGRLSFALKPISDTEAVTYGLGRGMGETIEVVTGGNEELLRYSGYLLRKRRE